MKKKMSYRIIARYIKNLSFNISKPEIFFSLSENISKYKFKVDIKSNSFKNNIIEVETTLSLEPKEILKEEIIAKATFSTLVEIDKNLTNKNELEQIILIDIPNKTYPELRKIFIFIFENSGFKDISIDREVDFKKLYLSRKN